MKRQSKEFPLYTVYSDGRIVRDSSGKEVSISYEGVTGRGKVRLVTEKLKNERALTKTVFLDEVIAAAFAPQSEEETMLIHKNGNKRDYRSTNLKWVHVFNPKIYEEVDYTLAIHDIKDTTVTDHNPIKYTGGKKNEEETKQDEINKGKNEEETNQDEINQGENAEECVDIFHLDLFPLLFFLF